MNQSINSDLAISLFGKLKQAVDPETKAFLDRCGCGWLNIFTPENKKHFAIDYPEGEDIHPEWLVTRVRESLLDLGVSLLAVEINGVRYCYYMDCDRYEHTGKSENGKYSIYLGNK